MECHIFLYQIQVFIKKVQSQELSINRQVRDQTGSSELIEEKETFIDEDEIVFDIESDQLAENSDVKNLSASQSKDSEKNDDEKLFSFKCHMCHVEFNKMFQLSAHTRSKHNCLPQVKCFCDKMLSTMRGLSR
jgi:hypothetical protein